MSDTNDKVKHSKRIQNTESHIAKQEKIAKAHGFLHKIKHKFHKLTATTCGNSNCVMCGNPRKFFNEKTVQEKSFKQTEKWDD
jgi:hypothetical protein